MTVSQKYFIDKTVLQFDTTAGMNTLLPTDVLLEKFDENKPDGVWPFRELVRGLVWLANQPRPDILNAVRTVARSEHSPQAKALEGRERDFRNVNASSGYGVTFQRGSGVS